MKKALLWLGGALLLLALLFLVKDYREKAALRPDYAFDTTAIAGVARLHVTYQGESVTLVRSGEAWTVGADAFPADTARLAVVLGHLVKVQTRERVSTGADTARLAEYGLNAGEAKRVEWSLADGRRFAILLGKTSGTDYSSTYWKFADKPDVYRTPGSFTHDVSVQRDDWRNRNLFPFFEHEDVESVEVEWKDTTGASVRYKLARAGDTTVRMTSPAIASRMPMGTVIPARNALAVLRQTPQFIIDDFTVPEDSNFARAALDTPVVVVRSALRGGSVYTLRLGRAFGGMYYARHPGMKRGAAAVIKIAAWRVNFFLKTPEQLLLPPPPDSPESIEGIEEQIPGALPQ